MEEIIKAVTGAIIGVVGLAGAIILLAPLSRLAGK